MSETLTVGDGRVVTLRRVTGADQPPVLQLLADLKLPTAGVVDWWRRFTVAESGGAIVGVAGIEAYGSGALLRSVAVRPEWRSTGLGRALVNAVLDSAREDGAHDAYLLTTTAEHYFPRLGFTVIPRSNVPPAVQASVEFRDACPTTAVVMHRPLTSATR
jgi:amino-acid N-acetyltransferase